MVKNKLPMFNRNMNSFVEGESNRFAIDSVYRLFEENGISTNPVVVQGASGVGKTHLAVGIAKEHPSLKTIYMCTMDIVTELLELIKAYCGLEGDPTVLTNHFTNYFIGYDAVIIDDLHILVDKCATQDAFAEIIKILVGCGKRIVILTDTPLDEYEVLAKILKETFDGLTICVIDKPEKDLVYAVIDKYSANLRASFEDDAVWWLAQQSDTLPFIISMVKKSALVAKDHKKISLSTIKALMEDS